MRRNVATQRPLCSGKILKVHERFCLVKKGIRCARRGSLGVGKQNCSRRIVSRAEFNHATIKSAADLRAAGLSGTSKSTKKQNHYQWKQKARIGAPALHGFGSADGVAGSSI